MMRKRRRRQMKNVLSAVRAPQTFGPFSWQLSIKMVWTNQTTDWSSKAPPPDDPQRPPEVGQGFDVDSDSGVVEQVQTTCHMRPSDELRPEIRSTRTPHPVVVMMFPMSLCCPVTHRRAKIRRTENREKLKWTHWRPDLDQNPNLSDAHCNNQWPLTSGCPVSHVHIYILYIVSC